MVHSAQRAATMWSPLRCLKCYAESLPADADASKNADSITRFEEAAVAVVNNDRAHVSFIERVVHAHKRVEAQRIEFDPVASISADYFIRGRGDGVEIVDGNIAQVFSTYLSFHKKDDKDPFVRGINSFQLMNDGKRWWVINIYWQAETPETPIPKQYLKSDK